MKVQTLVRTFTTFFTGPAGMALEIQKVVDTGWYIASLTTVGEHARDVLVVFEREIP